MTTYTTLGSCKFSSALCSVVLHNSRNMHLHLADYVSRDHPPPPHPPPPPPSKFAVAHSNAFTCNPVDVVMLPT